MYELSTPGSMQRGDPPPPILPLLPFLSHSLACSPPQQIQPLNLDAPHPRFPHPSQVAATSLETLRTAGLSQRKAEYMQGLAAKFDERSL